MIPEYVHSGEVKLVFRHMALLDDVSVKAAVASEAAAEQGAFWPYHDRLFDLLTTDGKGAFTDDMFLGIASDLGLDLDRWTAIYHSPQALEKVQNETRLGQQFGVRSTPTIFVAGQKVEGAQPYNVFEQLIDQRLQAAGR